ncbi:MAG TPA: GNAT family N-acetyltransferase [Anaerolineae bacterium]|nr:GNAT family N-acetyltransferase [Anaerolineae bacterium]
MIAIYPLTANSIQPFILMVRPGLRQNVLEIGTDSKLVVLGATIWEQPAGVVVAYLSDETVQLMDLYVQPTYRQGGIGTALLAAVEEIAQQTGIGKCYTFYRPDEHTSAFEKTLAKVGWQASTLSHIVFWTTRERDALHLDWVQQYRFEPPYEVVPWPDVTDADLQVIAQLGEEGRYPPSLSPLARPREAWDDATSFILRYEGNIAGWVCTLREAPLQLLIDILYVYPPRQRLGKMLIGEVTHRCWQIGMQDMYWRVAPNNTPMLEWSRRSFPDNIVDEYEEWYSEKRVRTADTIKAELRNFYGRMAEKNLQLANGSNNIGQSDMYSNHLYLDEELADLPATIVSGSLGCGNPHPIAALQTGEVVLDLGCGGGLDVLLAARRVGSTGFVYGVDMTDKMLELARANAAKVGVTNVEFRKSEIESLPLPDNSVDVIIANCVVNLSPETSTALAEAYRVLKPGGRLALAEVMVENDLSRFPISPEQIQTGLDYAGCIFGALTNDQITGLLDAAGFTKIDVTIQHRYSSDELLDRLPPEVHNQLHNLQPAIVQELMRCFMSGAIRAKKGS